MGATQQPGEGSPSASPKPSSSAASPSESPNPSASPEPSSPDSAGPGPSSAGSGSGPVGPPRVFMSMHGNNELATNSSLDDDWDYVRQNLDGIWGNTVGVDMPTQIKMWRKIKTRNIISVDQVRPSPGPDFDRFGPNSIPEETASDIKLNREAIALYTNDPGNWLERTIAQARARHASADMKYPYQAVYTGWGMGNFVEPGGPVKNADPLTPEAETALNQGDGAFVECLKTQCTMGGLFTDGFTGLMEKMHAQDKPVIFFYSPGNTGLVDFQKNYNSLKERGLWHKNDIIMLMNYHGNFDVAPETINGEPANTTTGMLYWALKQK